MANFFLLSYACSFKNWLFKFFLFLFPFSIWSCTTMLVTKGASSDGSIFVAHSDDDEVGDQRILYVPAADYPPGAKRAIYPFSDHYPRFVSKERGEGYMHAPGYPFTEPIGYIDQVSHTFSYFDGQYGIINEHQLAIGECTNAANVDTEDNPSVDGRLLSAAELSRIALERCTKAREAISLMGELAEKYGYNGWGETLLVADPEEGWVFEICSPPSKKGVLWVAKKIPDGEVFVAANQFRIRDILPDDPDMIISESLFKVAIEEGWWNPQNKQPLDWLRAVSPGEFNHPYYSLRRVWRIFSRIAPSLHFSPWVQDGYTRNYPFSIKPDKRLTLQDVMALYRDRYEGTEFDLSKGMAAGPFGLPYRYFGSYDTVWNNDPEKKNPKLEGAWERPISIYYCGYTYINQIRSYLPDPIGGVSWIGLNSPETTCFLPFYIGVKDLPRSIQVVDSSNFTFDAGWWVFNFVSNWIALKYSFMIQDVQKAQQEVEKNAFEKQPEIEKQALKLYKDNADLESLKKYLTDFCTNNSEQVLKRWQELSKYLIEKYADGFINKPKIAQPVGYPKWWRDAVGYPNGPITYQKPK